MHDVLRQRLLRKIESLPDDQVYQVLDYIEFLESKYVTAEGVSTSGLQKFAEGLEDKLRRRAVSPNTIREAFQLISAADRVLSGVSSAGRQILGDLGQALEVDEGGPATSEGPAAPAEAGEAQTFEADPRKRRAAAGRPSGAQPTSTRGGETEANDRSDRRPSPSTPSRPADGDDSGVSETVQPGDGADAGTGGASGS